MLILGRRRGERIIIETADGIITILPVMFDGDQVRIGIEAPGHIAVDREEVYRRKQREKINARLHGVRLIRWRYRQKQAEQGAEPLLEIWRG